MHVFPCLTRGFCQVLDIIGDDCLCWEEKWYTGLKIYDGLSSGNSGWMSIKLSSYCIFSRETTGKWIWRCVIVSVSVESIYLCICLFVLSYLLLHHLIHFGLLLFKRWNCWIKGAYLLLQVTTSSFYSSNLSRLIIQPSDYVPEALCLCWTQ